MCFLSGSLVLLQYQVLRRSKSFRTVSCEGASFPPRMAPKGSRLARLAAFEAWAVEHAGVLAERARTRPAASDDPIAQLLNVLRQKSSTEEQQYYHLLNGLQSRRWRAMDAEEREAAQRIWHTVSLRPVLPSNRGTADSAGVPAPVAEGSSASASGGDETAAVSRLLKYGDWRKASSSRLRSALGMFAPDAEAPRSALLQACEKLRARNAEASAEPAPRNLRLRYNQSVAIRAGGDVECAEAPAPGLPLPAGSPPAPQTGPHSSRIALVVDVGVLLGLAGRLRVLIDDRSAWG